ncbi:MAG: hypothetical protein CM15mP70_11180 [Pelagibacteraceae bacterium]|nr:MAG: hypothetical protein CM15mP70_11180 [Pelagibacteraceae bacterium]
MLSSSLGHCSSFCLASFSNDYWLFICAIYIVCESWLNDRAIISQEVNLLALYDCLISHKAGVMLVNLKTTTEAHL